MTALCTAPRTRRVLDWLKAFATERSLEWQQDPVGNIVIRRPGSGGGEDAPPVIVQGGLAGGGGTGGCGGAGQAAARIHC